MGIELFGNIIQVAGPLPARLHHKIPWYSPQITREGNILRSHSRSISNSHAVAVEFLVQMRLHSVLGLHRLPHGKRV